MTLGRSYVLLVNFSGRLSGILSLWAVGSATRLCIPISFGITRTTSIRSIAPNRVGTSRIVDIQNVLTSCGHDEYLHQQVKPYLPEPAIYMIRCHSFYAWHEAGAYHYLCDDHDAGMLPWVKSSNAHDLYTKSNHRQNWNDLKGYYGELMSKYLPKQIAWPV
ncbi:MAG: hypothetical protein ACI8Z1_001133 [Candidatus Azotimanducaceae bacterium]|jgi:hypothetical protein